MMKIWSMIGMACAFACMATDLWAQPPGGGQGGFNITPEMRARMEAWRKWRDQHKYTFQLTGFVNAMAQLDKEGKPLNADQKKKVLAVIKPLTTKTKLTQDDARNALRDLKKPLTTAQLNIISRISSQQQQRRGMGGGSGGGGGGRPGGGFGGGGGQGTGQNGQRNPQDAARRFMEMDPAKMKDYNPFNTTKKPDNPMTERFQTQLKQFMAKLSK